MTKLYTDTSANLPLALLREYDIAVIPFSYTVNGVAEDYNEETDFDGKAFYDAMRRGAEVKTSMVNPATAAAFFERALAQGDDVLYVGMSGGISGTAHAAALAAEELREKYPHAKIMTIDTYAASLGEGLQVLEAAELLRQAAALAQPDGLVTPLAENGRYLRELLPEYGTLGREAAELSRMLEQGTQQEQRPEQLEQQQEQLVVQFVLLQEHLEPEQVELSQM